MTQPVFRFAPSPNGRLHRGHAFSALLNARLAAERGGRMLLRIEDIDLARCTPELEAGVIEDLTWLGLAWEEPVRRQSEHFADYARAFERLRGVAYPCFCTRSAVAAAVRAVEERTGAPAPRDPDGAPLYPGTCRHIPDAVSAAWIAAGQPHAWRLDGVAALATAPAPLSYPRFTFDDSVDEVPTGPARWGDAVILRKDVPASYHLAVVHDDALQGVTHVVRGRDLEAATDLHVLLQRLLGLPTPLYHHHPLLTDAGGEKLAKSRSSEPLAALRAGGVGAGELRRELGFGNPPRFPR